MATAKKAPAKKAPAKKAPVKKAAAKKSSNVFSFKDSADKAINVYLGLFGKGLDLVQENIESARKDNDKRVKELEKRGVKLRKVLTKRMDNIEAPELSKVVKNAKTQINKVQGQVEDAVENVKEKFSPAKAA